MGQTFTGDGSDIESVSLYLENLLGSTGIATINLYAHTGTFGVSGIPTGSPLASGTLDVSTIPDSFTLVNISLSSYTLVNGTNYCLVMEYVDDQSNSTKIGYDSSSPAHPGNFITCNSSGVFLAQATRDAIFYVYGVSVPSTPLSNFAVSSPFMTKQLTVTPY